MTMQERTYELYCEFGELLSGARKALSSAYVLTGNMYPVGDTKVTRLDQLINCLDDLRSDFDEDYCREIEDSAVPEGKPRFPIYPAAHKQGGRTAGARQPTDRLSSLSRE